MKTSSHGIDLIARFEGVRLDAYRDAVGVPTIGYGHTRGVRLGQRITMERARELLRSDVAEFERAVNDAGRVPLSQEQFDALVSFSFNVGAGALRSSTLLRKLNTRDYAGAQHEFARWVKAGGHTLSGLVRRRDAEARLFGSTAAKPPDPLLPAERNALDRLAHWRRIGRAKGWERDGKPTEAKIRAEEWKAHIPAYYVAAIDAAVARDVKAGVPKVDAWKRHGRAERRRLLLAAITPPKRDRDAGEPATGDYPKGLPAKYRGYWDKPWLERPARSAGFRKWLDTHGLLSPHFTKAEAGSKDGVGVDAGGVNRAARDHAFNMERLRHALGGVPIDVISWFRTPARNRAVGGARNSQHMTGRASDHSHQWVEHVGRAKVARAAEVVFRNGGVGTYPAGSMHVDSRGYRARWSSF